MRLGSWARVFPSTGMQLQLLRPWVTPAIARSCTAEPNIGKMLCKELSLVFGRGSWGRIGQWRMGASGAAACRWAGYSLLMVAGAGPWQDERAAPGSGVVGCRRRWAERLAAWACPSCESIGPALPSRPWAAPTGWWACGIVPATLVDSGAELAHRGSPGPGGRHSIFLNIKGEIAGGKNIIKYQQRIIRMTRELSSTQLGRQRFANGFQMASKSQGIQPCTAISLASSLAFYCFYYPRRTVRPSSCKCQRDIIWKTHDNLGTKLMD